MESGNFNLENLLNGLSQNFEDYQDFVSEAEELEQEKDFQEFLNVFDEESQEKIKITNILKNLPEDNREYKERFKNSLVKFYRLIETHGKLFNMETVGLLVENIDVIINGENILQELRNKKYITFEKSNQLSEITNKLLINESDGTFYFENNNAKEFVDVLKENLNNASLLKDNSSLFEAGEKLLKRNYKENLEREYYEKFDDILRNLKGEQSKRYEKIWEILNYAESKGSYEEIRNTLIEIYEKDEENGTEIFNKLIDEIFNRIDNLKSDLEINTLIQDVLREERENNFYQALNARKDISGKDFKRLNRLVKKLSNEKAVELYDAFEDAVLSNASREEIISVIEKGEKNLKSEERESQKTERKPEKLLSSKRESKNSQHQLKTIRNSEESKLFGSKRESKNSQHQLKTIRNSEKSKPFSSKRESKNSQHQLKTIRNSEKSKPFGSKRKSKNLKHPLKTIRNPKKVKLLEYNR